VLLYGLRDGCEWDPHVLCTFHGRVQIEVFYVYAHETCTWGANGAINEDFYCGQATGFGTDIVWVGYLVPTHCDPYSPWLLFLWAVGYYDSGVGGLASGWYGGDRNEFYGVGSLVGWNACRR
jgi:hypothetical protein